MKTGNRKFQGSTLAILARRRLSEPNLAVSIQISNSKQSIEIPFESPGRFANRARSSVGRFVSWRLRKNGRSLEVPGVYHVRLPANFSYMSSASFLHEFLFQVSEVSTELIQYISA